MSLTYLHTHARARPSPPCPRATCVQFPTQRTCSLASNLLSMKSMFNALNVYRMCFQCTQCSMEYNRIEDVPGRESREAACPEATDPQSRGDRSPPRSRRLSEAKGKKQRRSGGSSLSDLCRGAGAMRVVTWRMTPTPVRPMTPPRRCLRPCCQGWASRSNP
jgi:hypothetical protein